MGQTDNKYDKLSVIPRLCRQLWLWDRQTTSV